MRYISNLNNKTVKELEKIVKNGSSLQLRQRAKSILLSNEGITVKEICKIFNNPFTSPHPLKTHTRVRF